MTLIEAHPHVPFRPVLLAVAVAHALIFFLSDRTDPPETHALAEPGDARPLKLSLATMKPTPPPAPAETDSPKPKEHQTAPMEAPVADALSRTVREEISLAKISYSDELRAMLERHKHYPVSARRLGQTGSVEVAFSILKDGTIVDIRLSDPCDHPWLNDAAVATVQRLARFKPLPEEFNSTREDFRLPIQFTLN